MKILITGTPGVGKTTMAKRIAHEFCIEHIDITEFVKSNKLYEEYDKKLDSLVFDEDLVIEKLEKHVRNKESFIIDTHSPVVAEKICLDFIFHIVCDTGEIARRLRERNYSEYKISKNLENEIFNEIGEELEELFHQKVHVVNGSDIPHQEAEYECEEAIEIIKQLI